MDTLDTLDTHCAARGSFIVQPLDNFGLPLDTLDTFIDADANP
jgi:hypothetical protein